MVWGDYWVIDLDEKYQLSAVSEPKREYLWILSRTPQVEPAEYDALLARLTAQGLDVSRLVRTPQTRLQQPTQ
jgi:apolipoprotein D and lipocalin family protein